VDMIEADDQFYTDQKIRVHVAIAHEMFIPGKRSF